MDNIVDAYTRLEFSRGLNLDVTYYFYNNKYTITINLDNINKLDYISFYKDKELIKLPFFSSNIMIEKIALKGHEKPLYINNYIDNKLFNKGILPKRKVCKIRSKVLDGKEEELIKRSIKIMNYNYRSSLFKFDSLFFTEKQKREFEYFINGIKEELKIYAKKNNLDPKFKYLNLGCTSYIYEIGDKIIKIGKRRRDNSIPYFEHVLQPIINKDIYFDGIPIHMEITEKVITYKDLGDNMELIDMFYEKKEEFDKKLKEAGLWFTDNTVFNLGILIKDNRIHFSGIKSNIAPSYSTSILYNNDKKILKEGELVILDLDCLKVHDKDKYNRYLESLNKKVR